MQPRFLLDEHISPIVAEILTKKGIDAVAVVETGLAQADDLDLLRTAVQERRIFVTYDYSDFAEHLASLAKEGASIPGVVFVSKAIRTNRFSVLANALSKLAARIVAGDVDPAGGVFLEKH